MATHFEKNGVLRSTRHNSEMSKEHSYLWNFKPSCGICCFVVQMSLGSELGFFCKKFQILEMHFKANILLSSLVPSTCLKSNQ